MSDNKKPKTPWATSSSPVSSLEEVTGNYANRPAGTSPAVFKTQVFSLSSPTHISETPSPAKLAQSPITQAFPPSSPTHISETPSPAKLVQSAQFSPQSPTPRRSAQRSPRSSSQRPTPSESSSWGSSLFDNPSHPSLPVQSSQDGSLHAEQLFPRSSPRSLHSSDPWSPRSSQDHAFPAPVPPAAPLTQASAPNPLADTPPPPRAASQSPPYSIRSSAGV